ncbi:MAG: epoxyqueuosine reductase [Paludibacteraceae bacterium]
MVSGQRIRQQALAVGFDDCGVALASRLDDDAAFMEQWVAQGLHGNMSYFERNREKRYDPRELVPGATAVVVCVLRYDKCRRDYHRTIKSMLYELDARLQDSPTAPAVSLSPSSPAETSPSSSLPQHIFCDSAPFLERRWAVRAGLGFIGRNHQFFHHSLGSMVHLGELVLTVPVSLGEPEASPNGAGLSEAAAGRPATPCADCHLCEEACPTGALRNPVWDATRCIAYTTHRCLICQQACPLNQL